MAAWHLFIIYHDDRNGSFCIYNNRSLGYSWNWNNMGIWDGTHTQHAITPSCLPSELLSFTWEDGGCLCRQSIGIGICWKAHDGIYLLLLFEVYFNLYDTI